MQKIRSFLTGKESFLMIADSDTKIILNKVPVSDNIVSIYMGKLYPHSGKYSLDLNFFFFLKEKTILFHKECGYLSLCDILGIDMSNLPFSEGKGYPIPSRPL